MWSTAPAGEWLETTRSIAAYLITHPCHDLHACLGCVSNHSRTVKIQPRVEKLEKKWHSGWILTVAAVICGSRDPFQHKQADDSFAFGQI
jgi:hypothetical protein